ncbi:Transcription factor [Coemansia sp. RSA 1722]|nr:Transcription factor [Coemansia sp. RSA 1722]
MCRDKDPATEPSSGSKSAAASGSAKPRTKIAKRGKASQQTAKDKKTAVPIAPAISASDASGNDGGSLGNSGGSGDSASSEQLDVYADGGGNAASALEPDAPNAAKSQPSAGASHSHPVPAATLPAANGATSSRACGGSGLNSSELLLFGNDVASNEFSALNEFLESLQRGVRSGERLDADLRLSNPPSSSPSGPPTRPAVGSPAGEAFGIAPAHMQPPYAGASASVAASASGRALSLPTISQLMSGSGGEGVTQTERFLLTAADPNDGTSEDKLRQIINAKYEAGILKPYNYVGGYTRMQRFMETHVGRASIMRIFEVLNTFRPTFRSIAQALTDIDLLLVEEGFERLLLDYDNVFNSFGVPACLWRRTGEIYKANREFADLVGVPLSYFHEGKLCIYELMSETSTVNYWEKYGEIAFDATQKAVLTTCVLQTAASVRSMVLANAAAATPQQQPGHQTRCCFSFTLRRDKYKIPLAIAGNFMPMPNPQK